MNKLALQAVSWYNEASKIIVLGSAVNTPSRIHLLRRCILDIVPQKLCSACNNLYPATPEYFTRNGKNRLSSRCKQCKSQIDKVYREAHADERHAYQKVYRQTHIEERRAYHKAYGYTHIEERRVRNQDHADNIYEKQRTYREKHAEKISMRRRAYRLAHIEEERAITRNRHARKKSNGGIHTAADIQKQYANQKGKCYYCQAKVGSTYHVDHVIPLSRNGSNDPSNLVIACTVCNARKYNKLPHEWPEGGRLL